MTGRTRVTAAAMAAAMVALAGCAGGDSDGGRPWPREPEPTESGPTPEEEPADDVPEADGPFGGLDGQEIGDLAQEALLGVDSLRMTGTSEEAGEDVTLDLHLNRAGDCAGTISAAPVGSFEIIKQGDEVWMQPHISLWENLLGSAAGPEALAHVEGRYLHGPVGEPPMEGAAESCDLANFLGNLRGSSAGLVRGEETEVNGIPALTLLDGEDKVLVATEGEPYPLRFATRDPTAPTIDFSAFDEPVPTDLPPADQIITVDDLRSGAFLN
ncbi:hypothetical protein [Streptomyces profundus]|uniref:hypothetical protein n=1 Tax=Streptomyces profundus TaxID=2867410 RepID=UPI001D16CD9A|nr:hypothetical protein [Streptomyces sp. MA3_2.13]UED85768.1 hypothetical protein K4G22_17510 [Streptomyces sp. MA3_2.13]